MGVGGMAAAPKAGFFDRGGMGVNILGGIADAVSTGFGGAPVFENRQREVRQRAYEDARLNKPVVQSTGNGGFAVINPVTGEVLSQQAGTPTPHYWETNDGSLGAIGPDGKPQILYKDPTPKVTWTQVDLPNGQKQLIPSINGQIQAGGAGPQRPAIGTVMADPRVAGGATPGGSRSFH